MIEEIFKKILSDKQIKPQSEIESNLDEIYQWYPTKQGFDEKAYTRNIVCEKDEDNQVVLACWQKGQMTPIHDHPKQSCWIYMLKGEIQESFIPAQTLQDYNFENLVEQTSFSAYLQTKCPQLSKQERKSIHEQVETKSLVAGQWHYIDDTLGLHQMLALSDEVVSLHFYRSL